MAQGDPIARGTIELGANTAPMEAALAGAKDKAVAQAQEIQQAVNTAATSSPDESAAYQAKLHEMAQRQHAEMIADLNEFTRETERSAQATTTAATAKVGAFQKIRNAINGSNDSLKDMGRLTAIIGRATWAAAAAVGAFKLGQAIRQYVIKAFEDGKDAADEFKNSIDFSDSAAIIGGLSQRLNELNGEIEEQQNSLYRRTVNTVLLNGVGRLEEERDELQKTLDATRKAESAKNIKAKSNEAKAEQATLEESLRLMASRRRLAFSQWQDEQQRLEIEAEDERLERERENNRKLAADRADLAERTASAQRDLIRQQQEQLAQLRNDINALYSSGNLEVGIGRVASLLETLIAKTEGRR